MIRALGLAIVGLLFFVFAAAAQNPQFKVGDRVAMPAGYGGKYLDALIIAVDPRHDPPFRVHALGYLNTVDYWSNGKLLKPYGSVPTEPVGKIADDPYLLALQGKKAFKPTRIYTGKYQCWTYTNGRLETRPILDFAIIDGHHYRDADGRTADYQFEPSTGTVRFESGTLGGQRGTYTQATDPPTKAQPPSITIGVDSCDRHM